MFWFIPVLFKAAVVYQGAKAAATVIDYATTDQEKEGRELGTMAAAKSYAPVLEDLEQQKKKIIAAMDRETSNVESRIKLLREQLVHYEHGSVYYKSKIETIKREHGDSPGVKAVLTALASSGGSAIGTGAMLGINSARAFSSAVCSVGISWLALPAAVVTYVLESEMNSKRERFFQEEFDKKAVVWLGKIESCRTDIEKSIKNLRDIKAEGADVLNRLAKIVDDALKECGGAQVKYNMLEMGIKQK